MDAITRWTRMLLGAALGAWLGGCGGGSGDSAPASAPASALRLETATAVTQTVGPAGGTLATTAADGTVYTLTVPAKALRRATTITLAPIASIADLPTGVSLAGGAHLTPEGQTFDVPIKLKLVLGSQPTRPLLPFTYSGELQERHRYPASVAGSTIEFDIVHFSGYVVLSAVLGDALGYFAAPSDRGDLALQKLVDATLSGLEPAARDTAMRNALQDWLDEFVKPEVEALGALTSYDLVDFMTGRVGRLANELQTFAVALKFAFLEASTADAFVRLQYEFGFEAALAARAAIDLSTAGCSTSPDHAVLLIAPDILAWQLLAQLTDAVVADVSLLRPAVLQALCVKPVHDPQDGVGFSADVQPGQSGLLTVRAGYSINAGPARFDLPMLIATEGTTNVSPSGFHTFEIGAGQTHAQQFQWHPQTTAMRIDVSACLLDVLLHEVCQRGSVVRELAALEVYFRDFSGSAGPQWSHSTITTSPRGQRYLGDFQRQTVSLSLADLPAHAQVRIEFDFFTISDWEGSATPSAGGPDTVVFRVDDQVLLWTSFSTKPGFAQAYPGSYPASSNPPMTGATATASLGYPGGSGHTGDATYRVSLTVPHTASSFAFSVIGGVNALEATGERWGLDNVRVIVLP